MIQQGYLTDEYEEQVVQFVESHPELDVSTEEVIEVFLSKCETFDELFLDEVSLSVVRQRAFAETKWHLKDEK